MYINFSSSFMITELNCAKCYIIGFALKSFKSVKTFDLLARDIKPNKNDVVRELLENDNV